MLWSGAPAFSPIPPMSGGTQPRGTQYEIREMARGLTEMSINDRRRHVSLTEDRNNLQSPFVIHTCSGTSGFRQHVTQP